MKPAQMTTLCQAIHNALESDDTDRAAALAYLGTRMCEDPSAELWARIEHHAEPIVA